MRARPIAQTFLSLLTIACAGGAPPPPPPPPPPPSALPLAPASAPTPAPTPPRADASLLPRAVLFGNPDREQPQLSPDGKHLAFLAPVAGVLQLHVGPADASAKAVVVTHEAKRGVRVWAWTYLADTILYLQDDAGDENWHVFAVDVARGHVRDLTPFAGAQARLSHLSDKIPTEIAIAINDRDKKWHDVYRVDLRTGERKEIVKNEGYAEIVLDDDFRARVAYKPASDGGLERFEAGATAGTWKAAGRVPLDDAAATRDLGFERSGVTLYTFDSRGRDTAALVALDTRTGKKTVLAEDAKADADGALVHPKTRVVQAVSVTRDRRAWHVVDPGVAADLAYLRTVSEGDFRVTSRTLDDSVWTVAFAPSDGPVRHYRYDRAGKARHAKLLFVSSAALDKARLARMMPLTIRARDGLELQSYLTLPRGSDGDGDGAPDKPLPLVLHVHGGPWARDSFGLSPVHQWLASRGYAVLSVNFRGSTGFGKRFLAAGNLEWGGKMHDDLLDAVAFAVEKKIADKDHVAILGGSYGGYAALVGLTFTPEAFACGVDIVGPSNLETLLATIPPYWASAYEQLAHRVGDPRTDEGKKLLRARSPLSRADRIVRPLLIGQGANDPRVRQAESDQIVKAMQARAIPVTYALYPDEGHGFARPENRISFYAVAETFFAQCVGGPYQPIGDDFKGSAISLPQGAEHVFGLSDALPKR